MLCDEAEGFLCGFKGLATGIILTSLFLHGRTFLCSIIGILNKRRREGARSFGVDFNHVQTKRRLF